MKQYGFNSGIVVSSDYHMQRVKLTYQRVFKDTDIRLIYCAAQDINFNPDRWWANNKSIMATINEYIKFIGYAFGRSI